MKTDCKKIIALILALVMMICMTACKDANEEAVSGSTASPAEQNASDGGEEEATEPVGIVKTIEGVDEDLGPRLPLMIDSIVLYEDGSVAIIPTEDLKKNEIPNDDADAVYPFEESGEVADIYVMDYGNGGYRTIVALLKDGTISAVNGRALVEDHIFAIMDDVANKENFVSVENRKDEDASSIVAITDDGDEVILDYSLNFDEPVQ